MPDDDPQQRALTALCLLAETCASGITELRRPPSTAPAVASAPAPAVLRKDFLALLSLIYAGTTKLALLFRQQPPAYKAALVPLGELGTHVASLGTCAVLFDGHGATLGVEVRGIAREVCESVRALARNLTGEKDESGSELVRAGEVHEIVDKAKSGLSSSNLDAIKKQWKADRGILEDTVSEVAELIESAEDRGEDGDEDEEQFDDGEWDELGLGSSKNMSPAELKRTKQVQPILRFSTMLHKRVQLDILVSPAASDADNATLDALPSHSHDLVLASEEVVSTLYTPQNPADIAASVAEHAEVVARLHQLLQEKSLLPSPLSEVEAIAEGVGGLSVSGGDKRPKRDVRKWYDTCFAQIESLSKSLAESLAHEPETHNKT